MHGFSRISANSKDGNFRGFLTVGGDSQASGCSRGSHSVRIDTQVHYELYIRKSPTSSWVLDLATEDRARALAVAEEALTEKRAVGVRVTKETLDEDTREFRSVNIMTKGVTETPKSKAVAEEMEPLCVAPSDLYTVHARDRITRLLDAWLARLTVSAFELLHGPELAEKLDASGVELQHAIQKVAVPEAQARGAPTHEIMRHFQGLVERTINRLMKDHRGGKLPDFAEEPFAAVCARFAGDPDRSYYIGAGVARAMGKGKTWGEKLGLLLDLADAAPQGPGRDLALSIIEQPLVEMISTRTALGEILGAELDLGPALTALTRLAGADAVDALLSLDPNLAASMPALTGPAARLANWLDGPHFPAVRAAISKRVLKELHGPRRLRPSDPEGEIKSLRLLAMALTATAGRVLTLDDIKDAFAERSKALTGSDFVDSLTCDCPTVRHESEALLRLAEKVIGGVAKRQAARWLASTFGAIRFEKEFRNTAEPPTVRLAHLAALQRGVMRANLVGEDSAPLLQRLGEIGAYAEGDSNLAAALARANAPLEKRLDILCRMAAGEIAPTGPAADKARMEALKLARAPEAVPILDRSPELLALLRALVSTNAAPAAAGGNASAAA